MIFLLKHKRVQKEFRKIAIHYFHQNVTDKKRQALK